jgi:hypothetical protein
MRGGRLVLLVAERAPERFLSVIAEDREDDALEVSRLVRAGLAHHDRGALLRAESRRHRSRNAGTRASTQLIGDLEDTARRASYQVRIRAQVLTITARV